MLPQNVTHLKTLPFTVYSPLHIPHSTVPIPHLAPTPDTRAGAPRSPARRCALHTSLFTFHRAHCRLHTLHSTLHTPDPILPIPCSTLCAVHLTLQSLFPGPHYPPQSMFHHPHSTLYTPRHGLQSTVRTLHFTLRC